MRYQLIDCKGYWAVDVLDESGYSLDTWYFYSEREANAFIKFHSTAGFYDEE